MGTYLKSLPCPNCLKPLIVNIAPDKKVVLLCRYCEFHDGTIPGIIFKKDMNPVFFIDANMN